jgi:hypothetical protein
MYNYATAHTQDDLAQGLHNIIRTHKENKNMVNNTETTNQDICAYFDDINDHIDQLELEESLQDGDDSEYSDALHERIVYLKKQEEYGAVWVDNDITASPDAWKDLETFTDMEARQKIKEWN